MKSVFKTTFCSSASRTKTDQDTPLRNLPVLPSCIFSSRAAPIPRITWRQLDSCQRANFNQVPPTARVKFRVFKYSWSFTVAKKQRNYEQCAPLPAKHYLAQNLGHASSWLPKLENSSCKKTSNYIYSKDFLFPWEVTTKSLNTGSFIEKKTEK